MASPTVHAVKPAAYAISKSQFMRSTAVHAAALAVHAAVFAFHAVTPTFHAAALAVHAAVFAFHAVAPTFHAAKYSFIDFNNPNHIILWYYNNVGIFMKGVRNMKKTWIIVLAIILLVVILPIISVASSYNKLVVMDETIDADWKQVENLMQRRYDLVPNLVEVTKGYATHERDIYRDSGCQGPHRPGRQSGRNHRGQSGMTGIEQIARNIGKLSGTASQ